MSRRNNDGSILMKAFVTLILIILVAIVILRVDELNKGPKPVSDNKTPDKKEVLVSSIEDRKIPLYSQEDPQWADIKYAGDTVFKTGCGPTCLSMCLVGLTGDEKYSPSYLVEYAKKHHYEHDGAGSDWTLISEGGEALGLSVKELPLVEKRVINSLEQGHPVILVLGPGVFTNTGHFVVLVDYKDGIYTVNDPKSLSNSQKGWKWKEFSQTIKNIWELSR